MREYKTSNQQASQADYDVIKQSIKKLDEITQEIGNSCYDAIKQVNTKELDKILLPRTSKASAGLIGVVAYKILKNKDMESYEFIISYLNDARKEGNKFHHNDMLVAAVSPLCLYDQEGFLKRLLDGLSEEKDKAEVLYGVLWQAVMLPECVEKYFSYPLNYIKSKPNLIEEPALERAVLSLAARTGKERFLELFNCIKKERQVDSLIETMLFEARRVPSNFFKFQDDDAGAAMDELMYNRFYPPFKEDQDAKIFKIAKHVPPELLEKMHKLLIDKLANKPSRDYIRVILYVHDALRDIDIDINKNRAPNQEEEKAGGFVQKILKEKSSSNQDLTL